MQTIESAKCECANCGQSIVFDLNRQGEDAPCPSCGEIVLLDPGAERRIPRPEIKPQKNDVPPPTPLAPAASSGAKWLRTCPVCSHFVSEQANACPGCGQPMRGRVASFGVVLGYVFKVWVALIILSPLFAIFGLIATAVLSAFLGK